MRKQVGFLALFFGALSMAGSAAADQLVTNGGFESGDLSNWTATGAITSSDFASLFFGVDTANAASGTYGAYLGSEFSPLTLGQSLTLQPTHYYTVSFSLAQSSAPVSGFTNLFSASFNGQTFFTESNAPVSPFRTYTYTLATSPAFSNPGLLQFVSQNDVGYFSLDDVSVSTGAATPEPATLLMVVPIVAGFALARRKIRPSRAA